MNENLTAGIFRIERLNNHNGPGLRTVIFMKGCPLHCIWCHNPEGVNLKNEIWYIPSKCIGCSGCVAVCPEKALELTAQGIKIDREKCTGCYQCVEVCPSKSLEKLREDVTTDYLMDIILRDKIFFQSSGGGVTVTGGEPGIYADFITELFYKCKQNGIQTGFDTSGVIPLEKLESVLQLTDLMFLDLKIMDVEKSVIYTGLDMIKLMDSVQWLKHFIFIHSNTFKLYIRTPLIPDLTDTNENLLSIIKVLDEIGEGNIEEWELCKFNDLCADKYLKMNKKWTFKPDLSVHQTKEQYLNLGNHFENLKIIVTGLGV